MDVVRLNFSHGTQNEHQAVIQNVRHLSRELDKSVAILQDLAGPKVRVGDFRDGAVNLRVGSSFSLTTLPVEGTPQQVGVSYPGLPKEVKPGDRLLLADGSIELQAREIFEEEIRCTVLVGGQLGSRKGLNLPSGLFGLPILSGKDLDDLEFGLKNGVDFVGLSFVRDAEDVRLAKNRVAESGHKVPVIAKIETQAALNNFSEILAEADGIMIARGDLSIETPFAKVPIIQKQLIREAIRNAKPVITATQMLWSMVKNPHPTRAEVADVANAILDGSDAIMLSEETTIGEHPFRAVQAMVSIARETENAGEALLGPDSNIPAESTAEAVARTACDLAERLHVDVIGTVTLSGQTPRYVAKYRPGQPILAVTTRAETYQRLSLIRGVVPFLLPEKTLNPEELIGAAFQMVRHHGWQGKQAVFVSTDRVRKGTI